MTQSVQEQITILTRGTVEVIPEGGLKEKLQASMTKGVPLVVKAGFDPTAPDIHLGHTVLLQKMKQFQDLGHRVVFLIGDFTAMIGDPSGQNEMRKPMTRDEVLRNAETYKEQVFKILSPNKTEVKFNSEWFFEMKAMWFILLAGKQTVARMLERADFKERFKNNKDISIQEFLYPLLQGYDSFQLKADVELGGTDQKFNLLMARTVQERYGQEPQVIMTLPLLVGLDGTEKMSKSLGNYVGITEPPDEIFGKLMSVSDDLMWQYYELLSDLSLEEIQGLKAQVNEGKAHPKDVKALLAEEIAARFHTKEAARKARENFDKVFSHKETPQEMDKIEIQWPEKTILLPVLLEKTGLCKSRTEARNLIRQGGVDVDGRRVSGITEEVPARGQILLKVGKRKFRTIHFV